MLTLQNFDIQVNPTILQRGKQYYNNENIASIEETGNVKFGHLISPKKVRCCCYSCIAHKWAVRQQ